MITGLDQARRDLKYCFDFFPTDCLLNLQNNLHRLCRRSYYRADGYGCIFYFLAERMPVPKQIVSKESLTRFFTGGEGFPYCEEAVYQPARWLVRLFDEQLCVGVKERYPGMKTLSRDVIACTLLEYLEERMKEDPPQEVVRRTMR